MNKGLKNILLLMILIFSSYCLDAQMSYFRSETFTKKDTLRGKLNPQRSCFDVIFYDLTVDFNIKEKSIKGSNKITYNLLNKSAQIQIDLFENLLVESVKYKGENLNFTRILDAIIIDINEMHALESYTIEINYSGSPSIADNPPWDGGFIWQNDTEANPWVHVSCQGVGASLWWPNKDHLSDEPDSMNINLIVPNNLKAISNGDLKDIIIKQKKTEYQWHVQYPINNYNVSFSIGNYSHFEDEYLSSEKGSLKCDYYILPENVKKAKKHFKQVNQVLEAFEHYLGPYPFWEDGFALIETPYLGMEHQSAIAYGNKFQKGYLGGMIPSHMSWDYIIVHETAHEYWGNAVSCNDYAEIWIHEAFATYMEALYVEYHFGRQESVDYLQTQRNHKNHFPIVGPLDVNFYEFKDDDHYFKGAWVIHTLRSAIDNDELFFDIISNFYNSFKYKNASSAQFFQLVESMTGKDYKSFFDQYLYQPQIPILEYDLKQVGKDIRFQYKWNSSVTNFNMPVHIFNKSRKVKIIPKSGSWSSITIKDCKAADISIGTEYFLIEPLRNRRL